MTDPIVELLAPYAENQYLIAHTAKRYQAVEVARMIVARPEVCRSPKWTSESWSAAPYACGECTPCLRLAWSLKLIKQEKQRG